MTYERYDDARLAISKYDRQAALGQLLGVELDAVVPPPREDGRPLASRIEHAPDRRRGSRPARGGRVPREEPRTRARRGPVTLDDLDNELDNYINQRPSGSVAESGAEASKGDDGMQID